MCGIAGAIGAIDPTLVAHVRTMMDAQTHRGPDDSGMFESDTRPGVAFGFRRLSIIDLSADGHQPMVDHERRNVVVFNGEIYNYRELKRALEAEGEQFHSKSDTEVLLRGYGRWGESIVSRLRGMFGFAIYDAAKRKVFMARDRLGIKPLYYAEVQRPDGKALLFASELRALLATDLFPRKLDPTALATYLWNGFVVGHGTVIRGISILPGGATLTYSLDEQQPRLRRYWTLGPRQPTDEREALATLERELSTAASQHLIADVPLGVFLSGGVDSSAVAALAVRGGGQRIRTFHIGFEEAGFDESAYARTVSESLGTEHAEFRLTQSHFQNELEPALASLDQPSLDGINTYFVSRVVREAGFTVALAGTGGDEIFGGYKSFRDLPRAGSPLRAARLVPEPVLSQIAKLIVRLKFGESGEVPPQMRWGKIADLLATHGDAIGMYQVAYGLFTRDFLGELTDAATLSRAPSGLPEDRQREFAEVARQMTPISAISHFELAMFLGERLLRDTDAASMATSLEVRVPLLDHAVVEAAQAVPDRARFEPVGKKQLLKTLAMPNLDHKIFDRPKSGFVLPIEVWAKDRLAGEIGDVLADRALAESVGLSAPALSRLFRSFRADAPGIYWSRVWAPYVFLQWCRRHRVSLG